MEREARLKQTIAHALGHYMGARIRGEEAATQLRRLKRLQEAYRREYTPAAS
ncbi:MAG: hypothetical protein IJ767_04330 [Bacteroidaceae bacterium]|nr:hypothetical protein [Bacteroidaceae bacterium]